MYDKRNKEPGKSIDVYTWYNEHTNDPIIYVPVPCSCFCNRLIFNMGNSLYVETGPWTWNAKMSCEILSVFIKNIKEQNIWL